jgi:hypothetical protein
MRVELITGKPKRTLKIEFHNGDGSFRLASNVVGAGKDSIWLTAEEIEKIHAFKIKMALSGELK